MDKTEQEQLMIRVMDMLDRTGIVITDAESEAIELADLNLGRFEVEGLAIVVYENNDRYCAKELLMLPFQTCPEHLHPPIRDAGGNLIDPGKRETFRVRAGAVHLFTNDGPATSEPIAKPPTGKEQVYTASNETVLRPGDQYTIEPGVLHWFQSGQHGAIVSEFSSTSRDEYDVFTDPAIIR